MEHEEKHDDDDDSQSHVNRAEVDLRQGKILLSGDGAVLLVGIAVIVTAVLMGIKGIVEAFQQ